MAKGGRAGEREPGTHECGGKEKAAPTGNGDRKAAPTGNEKLASCVYTKGVGRREEADLNC